MGNSVAVRSYPVLLIIIYNVEEFKRFDSSFPFELSTSLIRCIDQENNTY